MSELLVGEEGEPKIDASMLKAVEKIEDLRPYVGQYIYWNNRRGDDRWAQAKLIWTGDPESRYFTESLNQRFVRETVFHDPTLNAVADIRAKLQAFDPTIVEVEAIDELEQLKPYELQSGMTPEAMLAVKHDRNQYRSPGNEAPLGDHYEIILLDKGRDGKIRETGMSIPLNQKNLSQFRLSVKK